MLDFVEGQETTVLLLPPCIRIELRRNWQGRLFAIQIRLPNAPQLSETLGVGNVFTLQFRRDHPVNWTATITGFEIRSNPELEDFWNQVMAAAIRIVPKFRRMMTALIQEAAKLESDTRDSWCEEVVVRLYRCTDLADFYLLQLACHEVICQTIGRTYDAAIILAEWTRWWNNILKSDETVDPEQVAIHLEAIAVLDLKYG